MPIRTLSLFEIEGWDGGACASFRASGGVLVMEVRRECVGKNGCRGVSVGIVFFGFCICELASFEAGEIDVTV